MSYKRDIKIRQAKNLLFLLIDVLHYNSGYIVNLVFIMTSYCFVKYSQYLGWFEIPEREEYLLTLHFKYWDASLCCLLFMLASAKLWNAIAWTAYLSLCVLWIINYIYIIMNWEADLYFAIYFFIVGINYIGIAVYKLINKN